MILAIVVLLCIGVAYWQRNAKRVVIVDPPVVDSPIIEESEMDDQESMFEESSAFLFSWSDVFYNFLGIASNDCSSVSISVTPLQDIDPNELA